MKILTVGSIIRNGTGYLARYDAQLDALSSLLRKHGWGLRLAIVENDSTDDTWAHLPELAARFNGMAWNHQHGAPDLGSVVDERRQSSIALTWNRLFAHTDEWQFDAFLYVEADLMWEPETMWTLLAHLDDVPAVAPLNILYQGNQRVFYDVWGYRRNGQMFSHADPFHPDLAGHSGLLQIDNAGSCIAMRSEVGHGCRMDPAVALTGGSIYERGYSLWLDPALEVRHPNA